MESFEWTDEITAQVIADYQSADPTPENTMEICKQIAEEIGASPNGVRMLLSNRSVYVTKGAGSKKTSSAGGDKPKRVSKADAQAELTAAITDLGGEIEEAIIEKLTGKAALYLAGVLRGLDG